MFKERDLKTSSDAETIIYRLINVPALTSIINGSVYKGGYIPTGHELLNVVVNSVLMPMSGRVQDGTFNVNAYVPFKNQNFSGQTIKVPDLIKIDAVKKVLVNILKKVYEKNYSIYIEYESSFKREDADMTIVNIRVKFVNNQY